jgi:predicted CopG family antitoxin
MVKTIRVSDETHRKINQSGKRGESFEDIILRLIKEVSNGRRDNKKES